MNKFYIYLYLDQFGVPFYVGKGSSKRYKIGGHLSRQPFLANKINKIGKDNVIIKILHKDLTEEQAFYLEEKYIAGIGRRDLGLGPLCNLTNGGDGHSGFVQSEETKAKRAKLMTGNKYNLGKKRPGRRLSDVEKKRLRELKTGTKMSGEQKEKISQALKGRKISDDVRKKISLAKKGQPSPRLGCKLSEATKMKISETKLKGRNNDKK